MIKVVEVKKQRETTLEDVCLHEAGHVAMAFEFGIPVRGMQIDCDPATGNMDGLTNIQIDFVSPIKTRAMFEVWKKDRYAYFKSAADSTYALHVGRIFVTMGGIAVNQRIRGITDPGRVPGYCPDDGTGITSGVMDDSDAIEQMIPDLGNIEHRFHHNRAVNAFLVAMRDVHHIMDNPSVWKGMQALADALLAAKKLTGAQACKIYFDARGPIPPVSSSSLKKSKSRLRKVLPRINLAALTAEVKAVDKPEGIEA